MISGRRSVSSLWFAATSMRNRQIGGYQISEFTAALVVLVIGIVVPLVDLAAMPLHWILSQEIITSEARRLAQSESFSSAIAALDNDPLLRTRLLNLGGVKPLSTDCKLIISMLNKPYESFVANEPKSIPAEWLPEGKRSPCYYELEITVVQELSPLVVFNAFNTSIPGLTRPFICTIKARAHWENYGRNPVTKRFYMNE